MAASSSNNLCINCKDSTPYPLLNGWKFRTDEFAQLCRNCFSVYKAGKFCEKFHLNEGGWRECESCTKPVHCGCIVSLRDYTLHDFGGITCLKCMWADFELEPSIFNTLSDPIDVTDLVRHTNLQPQYLQMRSISRVLESDIVLLFEKVATKNDARRQHSYIIIPNKHGRTYFLEAFKSKLFPISILDTDGKNWNVYFRCWVSGNKRKFVLKGLTDFIISKNMLAGDTVAFYRRESDGKIILEIRKPCLDTN